jgi:hypothetical protein
MDAGQWQFKFRHGCFDFCSLHKRFAAFIEVTLKYRATDNIVVARNLSKDFKLINSRESLDLRGEMINLHDLLCSSDIIVMNKLACISSPLRRHQDWLCFRGLEILTIIIKNVKVCMVVDEHLIHKLYVKYCYMCYESDLSVLTICLVTFRCLRKYLLVKPADKLVISFLVASS